MSNVLKVPEPPGLVSPFPERDTPPPRPDRGPPFYTVFFTVLVATLLAAGVAVYLAFVFGQSSAWSAQQNSVFQTMNDAAKVGLGAILGLIGARGNASK